MRNVFISYAHGDKEIALTIKNRLLQTGEEYMIMEPIIFGASGAKLIASIDNILESSNIFILLISSSSLKNDWSSKELYRILGYTDKLNDKVLIPVVIDGVEVPSEISSRLYISGNSDDPEKIALDVFLNLEKALGFEAFENTEKKKYVKKVEENYTKYIDNTLVDLKKKEKSFLILAYICYISSFVVLIVAIVFALKKGSIVFSSNLNISKEVAIALSTIIISSLMIALSRFFFTLGKSFMVESLRNSNRIHAISFGEFYLNVFGDKIEWNQLKEAFQHWNIDIGSSFSTQSTNEYDPQLLSKIGEIVRSVKT